MAWKELLLSALDLSEQQILISSDPRDPLGGDEEFANTIHAWIEQCTAILSIQTPVSRHRPWIIWEAGVARGFGKTTYVVVYQDSLTQTILGNLGTPLDAKNHKDGMLTEHVKAVVEHIRCDLRTNYRFDKLDGAVKLYIDLLSPFKYCWRSTQLAFDKKIDIIFSSEAITLLQEDGTISDKVDVIGERESMLIFSTGNTLLKWPAFVKHLDGLPVPWKGSAARWARSLARPLQKALTDSFIDDAEGLPLYYDSRGEKSYRPSIVLREDEAGSVRFRITFTLLPPELTARPNSPIGTLLQYLDFCRMMKWGLLEKPKIKQYFSNPAEFSAGESEEIIRAFFDSLSTIRTEFWNRGLKRDSILHALNPQDRSEYSELYKRYEAALAVFDPGDLGTPKRHLPDIDVLQDAYEDIPVLIKEFYLLYHRAFGDELTKL